MIVFFLEALTEEQALSVQEYNSSSDEFELDEVNFILLPHMIPFNSINEHSIVIVDNAAIHHVEAIHELLAALGSDDKVSHHTKEQFLHLVSPWFPTYIHTYYPVSNTCR